MRVSGALETAITTNGFCAGIPTTKKHAQTAHSSLHTDSLVTLGNNWLGLIPLGPPKAIFSIPLKLANTRPTEKYENG
jgi:hypothetical protein